MSKHQTTRQQAEDDKLWFGLVKDRLISEAQLHTAQDYQRAVGGNLDEIILRLGFVDRPSLERFLASNRPSGRVRSGGISGVPERGLQDLVVPPPLPGRAPVPLKAPSLEKEKTLQLRKIQASLPGLRERGADSPVQAPPAPAAEPRASGARSEAELVLEALMRVLIRKGIISNEEVEEELRKL